MKTRYKISIGVVGILVAGVVFIAWIGYYFGG